MYRLDWLDETKFWLRLDLILLDEPPLCNGGFPAWLALVDHHSDISDK